MTTNKFVPIKVFTEGCIRAKGNCYFFNMDDYIKADRVFNNQRLYAHYTDELSGKEFFKAIFMQEHYSGPPLLVAGVALYRDFLCIEYEDDSVDYLVLRKDLNSFTHEKSPVLEPANNDIKDFEISELKSAISRGESEEVITLIMGWDVSEQLSPSAKPLA